MRLIDADALMETLERGDWVHITDYNIAIYAVKDAPTVDAVTVVRCRDCKWRDDQKGATEWMPCRALITPNDFYCPSGERKENGNEANGNCYDHNVIIGSRMCEG